MSNLISQRMIIDSKPFECKKEISKKFENWSVDRLGRLISGSFVSIFLLLSLISPYWIIGSLLVGLSLVITSITDKCMVHDLLMSLGAKEREDIFLPGGELKSSSKKIEPVENLVDHSESKRRLSATSQALLAIKKQVEIGSPKWDVAEKVDFRISVAANRVDREKAYKLSQKVYGQCGYSSQDQDKLFISDNDARPDTITFIAEDMKGDTVASITVVSNVHGELPCQKIFGDELIRLNNKNKKIVEITRLVVDESHRNSRSLIKIFMNFVYIHSFKNLKADNMLIEVNPRHSKYYQGLLCFEVYGASKPCDRVKGAPAVLLNLSREIAEAKTEEGRKNPNKKGRKTLCNYFAQEMEESFISDFIRESSRPMSEDEMFYFGLTQNEDMLLV